MGWKSMLGLEKKKKKASARRKTAKKSASKKPKTTEAIEEPIMTVSRQLTNLQRDLQNIDGMMHSGFKGLREDHHKILEEQFSKIDIQEFKKYLEKRTVSLKQVKGRVEAELGMLEIDRRILDLLGKKEMRALEISKELKISRQYASERLNELVDKAVIKRIKKGRKIYYRAG